jgi:hypothetical protein
MEVIRGCSAICGALSSALPDIIRPSQTFLGVNAAHYVNKAGISNFAVELNLIVRLLR